MELSPAEANIELTILDSRAQDLDPLDTLARYTNAGLPQEVVQRLHDVWDKRQEIAGKAIHIGRIIFLEVNRFVDENPNLSSGVALGAAVGALTSMIPGIGPLLAPFATAAAILTGALLGKNLDDGGRAANPIAKIAQELVGVARKFFELLAAIFRAVRAQFVSDGMELAGGTTQS